MHPNVARGNKVHADHFAALNKNSMLAQGWELYSVNKQINFSGLRPDWIILNRAEKRAFILDVTTKYSPRHYKKGQNYVVELQQIFLREPGWNIVYLEDYWLNATIH